MKCKRITLMAILAGAPWLLMGCLGSEKKDTENKEAWYSEAQAADPDGVPVSVVSYNIFNIYAVNKLEKFPVAEGTRPERMKLLVQEIKAWGDNRPTFLLVQEAFHNETRDQFVKDIADSYAVVNNDGSNIISGAKFGSGLLIFYRQDKVELVKDSEIFEEFNVTVSALPEVQYATKGFHKARFRVGDAEIEVYNTHLSSVDSDGEIRRKQLEYIKERMRTEASLYNPVLQILGGDFNTDKYDAKGRLSPPLDVLRNGVIEGFSMLDAIDEIVLEDIATWDRRNVLVEVAKWPLSKAEQIDHIYLYSPLGTCQPDLLASGRVLTKLYPMAAAKPIVEARKKARNEALDLLWESSLDQQTLELYRIKGDAVSSQAGVWQWDEQYSQRLNFPSKEVRDAIDKLLVLTPLSHVNIEDLASLEFQFPKDENGVYMMPLSDHYGIKAEIRCSVDGNGGGEETASYEQ